MVVAGDGSCNTVLCGSGSGGGNCNLAGPTGGLNATAMAGVHPIAACGDVWVPGGCATDAGGTNCIPGSWQPAPGGGGVGCSVCTPILPPGGSGPIAISTCNGELQNNTSINGQDDHNDQISNSFALWAKVGAVTEQIAYEYQTYGGNEYISFLVNFSGSINAGPIGVGGSNSGFPIFPFNGSVYGTLQSALAEVNEAQAKLPFPWNQLTQNVQVKQDQCKQSSNG